MAFARAFLCFALIAPTFGCSRPPAARLEVTELPARHLRLWCHHRGLNPPVKVLWHIGLGTREVGTGPRDGDILYVEAPSPRPGFIEARCDVTDSSGVKVEAGTSLVPPVLKAATIDGVVLAPHAARGVLAVEGQDLGTKRGAEDGVWLLPAHGAPVELDTCPAASWSPTHIAGCIPPSLPPESYEIRVQTGGRLARLVQRLVVTP